MSGPGTPPRILLIVGGGIAAYKACELVRTICKNGGEVTCVLTQSGAKFVTAMALAALSENPVHTTLWDLKNEVEMGHIQLSRQADLVVVCPATANLMAKMASGIADDLATTLLLATDKPVMAVPAMNVRMWQHASTIRNVQTLRDSGVDVMEPDEGAMACGEYGPGRLPEPLAVWQRIAWALGLDPVEVAPLPGQELAGQELVGLADYQDEPFPATKAAVAPDHERLATEGEGLGGLSGSMIARGIKKAAQAMGLAGPDEVEAEPLPVPGASGPLLSRKGDARAAPPTDPEAINHIVTGHEDGAPQPVAGDTGGFISVGGGGPAQEPAQGPVPFEPVTDGPLHGRHVLVTAGPTWEPIDPVRYIANRSSGIQGFAIAAASALAGARVTLVSGPVHLATPPGVDRIDVESAQQMADAVKKALPADVAVMVAAVADWRTMSAASQKMKKRGSAPPALILTENPDILASVASSPKRPKLLIGFAAETENVIDNAANKRKRKGADWIVANDVSGDVMGGQSNTVHIVTGNGIESLPEMPKEQVAHALVERFADALAS